MLDYSRPVSSNQNAVHTELESTVCKHLQSDFQQPYKSFSSEIFQQANAIRAQMSLPVILDSGCGTGQSSVQLAKDNPNHLVIGIDKSAVRLNPLLGNESVKLDGNLLLIRSNLIDFWRLAVANKWTVTKHYLLYPNPWPKKKHLMRRWHAHPVFPSLIQLGGRLICRSNWQTYLEELSLSLQFAGQVPAAITLLETDSFISPFELKYHNSGHDLYELVCKLEP